MSENATAMLNVTQILNGTYKYALEMFVSKLVSHGRTWTKFFAYLALRCERLDALLSASEPLSDILLTSESDIVLQSLRKSGFSTVAQKNFHQCTFSECFFFFVSFDSRSVRECVQAVASVKLSSRLQTDTEKTDTNQLVCHTVFGAFGVCWTENTNLMRFKYVAALINTSNALSSGVKYWKAAIFCGTVCYYVDTIFDFWQKLDSLELYSCRL